MSPQPYAFLGGKQVPLAEAKVGVMTHALHYGTAVFEGVRGNWSEKHGKMFVFRLREHYERLLRGSNILKIELPYGVEDLIQITTDLVERNGYREDVYIRPLAFKSAQLVANLKLHEVESDFTLIVVPFGAYIENDGAIRCQTSSWRRPDDTMIPTGVKLSGLYTTGILAKTEAVMAGYDEAIVLNHDGTVSEGTGENLFLVRDGVLHTPSETDNCLLGITRECVIELAQKEFGMKVVERRMHRSELYLSDEVFLTGTAAHLTAVGELDNRQIGSGQMGPITRKLQDMYFDIVVGNNPDYMHWLHPITPSGG
ncbi:MAG TPA: branched-chain amino acid transaminase [Dehalococcoidia bacterium]|jgi:branched-chain amino acid aminotransferase|nr:branched chain amino acid aminotransferase [Chloroflexota bacterium]MDP5876824.1 branched-chain amino acid transaminase [Dehalococcoidia bacterium]MDP7160081.1 branched-chain amino acid transaminase [Dehalococcoidia bacterium]MDP7213408.1 branched-chain amino acid transaminase [Dehalococcoidia bacterium]MDP7514111.1 branched-chain amino acid transaminase [Dehalococcoidia bacterium]|tara:strand:- start:489 stop:1424 length:936 start_codon:yes stop_codon:yes gene_type:complete